MPARTHAFELGDFQCLVIQDQTATMPLADLVANAEPQQLAQVALELGLPSEGITVGYNCLLVRTGHHNVLVDAGYGRSLPGREGALLQGLQAAGLAAEQIDRVVITHADRDHIGGLLDRQGALIYPNAAYLLWQGAWDFWRNEANTQDWPPEIVAFVRGTFSTLEPRLQRVEAGQEFLPGFQILPAVGHRHEHVVLHISSGSHQLLHLADAVIHPLFMAQPHWASTYDSVPDQALAVKKQLLDRAASEEALLFGAHFPFPGLGRVRQGDKGWQWLPATVSGGPDDWREEADSTRDFSRLKRPLYEMPDEVRAALLEQGLMAAYRHRPPYQQNDYIGWITRAVRPETRQRRLAQMLDELARGDKYMKMDYRPKGRGPGAG